MVRSILLLGCDTVHSVKWIVTFGRVMLLSCRDTHLVSRHLSLSLSVCLPLSLFEDARSIFSEKLVVAYKTISFPNGSTAPWGPRPPHFSRLHDHTQTHHTR
jgi:hypothetical protein